MITCIPLTGYAFFRTYLPNYCEDVMAKKPISQSMFPYYKKNEKLSRSESVCFYNVKHEELSSNRNFTPFHVYKEIGSITLAPGTLPIYSYKFPVTVRIKRNNILVITQITDTGRIETELPINPTLEGKIPNRFKPLTFEGGDFKIFAHRIKGEAKLNSSDTRITLTSFGKRVTIKGWYSC